MSKPELVQTVTDTLSGWLTWFGEPFSNNPLAERLWVCDQVKSNINVMKESVGQPAKNVSAKIGFTIVDP